MSAAAGVTLPPLPALVPGRIGHARLGPVRRSFVHRAYLWLVDLDDLPALPAALRPLGGFHPADHVGDPRLTIRQNVTNLLAAHGVGLGPGGRVLMLSNARVLGHVFDPLTVFWCLEGAGGVACVVAEVHNTYGERHAYVLRPVPGGADGEVVASAPKELYVSPFFDVSGSYDLRFVLRPDRVEVAVTLRQDNGSAAFRASFRGRPRPASAGAVLRSAVALPLMPQRASTLIRLHGIRLFLRGLPVHPRPRSVPQTGV